MSLGARSEGTFAFRSPTREADPMNVAVYPVRKYYSRSAVKTESFALKRCKSSCRNASERLHEKHTTKEGGIQR